MSNQMPATLPAGSLSLPPFGGRLLAAYRILWWLLLAFALAAIAQSWIGPSSGTIILGLRLSKSLVLITVSAILFRRRGRDPVAAMLALAFLLWTASSSIDLSSSALLPAVLDRFRFVLFALALLLFPDGKWQPKWTPAIASTIGATFLIGLAEAIGLVGSKLYLPAAIGCVIFSLGALSAKYRALEDGTDKQQLKWVTLGLFAGISLILTARASAALTAGMAMPFIGSIAIEGLFQLGIVVLALGFLISLLRYRLYDAEAVISRSAIYAALTLSLVGTFAACEALIELLGQRYFGSSIGSISGTVAAAMVAALLAPLHNRISGWAEERFHHDLAVLRRDLPDQLLTLSSGSSLKRLAKAVLPRIEHAVQSTRMALLIDGRLVAVQGIELAPARRLLKNWNAPETPLQIDRDDDGAFPLRMALRCPFGTVRGWLLLGPRPDGSFYGKDDLAALADIARPLQRSLFAVAEQEAEQRRNQQHIRKLTDAVQSVEMRIEQLKRRAA
jgi:hypothetical protein